MGISFEGSLRVDLRRADPLAVERAIDDVGHVVLDGCLEPQFLSRLRDLAELRFVAEDRKFGRGFDGAHQAEVDGYLAGVSSLESLAAERSDPNAGEKAAQMDKLFYGNFSKSGLPRLFQHLFRGKFFVARNERVIRRVDPAYPLRFAGLHCDGQLHHLSTQGIRSKREFTLWTPLQDCADDRIPRLLLMHRGDNYTDVLTEKDVRRIEGTDYFPIQLRPYQVRGEKELIEKDLPGDIEAMFDRIFSGTRCYAPFVPLGSSVLFDHNIWHGSYFRRSMTRPRYSLDFRTVGEFARSEKTNSYSGELLDAAAG